jgi:hypothetical protein
MKKLVFIIAGIFITAASYAQVVYNVTDFGARGDTNTVNTAYIQAAIDKCSAGGGGKVLIPNGTFLTGTIVLKNNVELHLEVQAKLKGSPDFNDYPLMHTSRGALVYAYQQDNVSISGTGTIDGSGDHANFQGKDKYNGLPNRPFTVLLNQCTNIRLKEFTLRNGAFWCIKLLQCNNATVDDIQVISRVVANNDGIDITDSYNVRLSNCFFDCGDDAICPKSESKTGVKKLAITNCIIKSESNGIKFGTASQGGFEDVVISNCHIYDTRLAGIALELVDGGVFDRITINNITMHNVNGGLFMKLGLRRGDTGILRNVMVSNLIADGIGLWQPDTAVYYFKPPHNPKIGMSIVGQPGFMVENVTLQNVYMQFAGGGTHEDAQRVMEDKPETYPEYNNFGITPAYAFNFRHVKNLTLDNIQVDYVQEDMRPALFFENVVNADIGKFKAGISLQSKCFIRCKDIKDFFIHSCKPQSVPVPFLSLEGKIEDVTIMNNDFSKIKNMYIKEPHISKKEIKGIKYNLVK